MVDLVALVVYVVAAAVGQVDGVACVSVAVVVVGGDAGVLADPADDPVDPADDLVDPADLAGLVLKQ